MHPAWDGYILNCEKLCKSWQRDEAAEKASKILAVPSEESYHKPRRL